MLRGDERAGLIVALALHAALIGVLLPRPRAAPPQLPERISVTISDQVAPRDAAPAPAARAAPDVAPVSGEPRPAAVPLPAPSALLVPEPVPRQAASPRPAPQPPVVPPTRHEPAPGPAKPRTAAPAGAGRVGRDFLSDVPDASAGEARVPPAAAIGPAVVASIGSAIARQLKPHWVAPQGVDAEQLVTFVQFRLNRDGSLDGPPRVVRQAGVTPGNRAQQQRHAEQAIRAVELSAPFDLPGQYYAAWQTVTSRFDRRLSQ